MSPERVCKGCGKGPIRTGTRIKGEDWHPACWLKANPDKRADTVAWLETNAMPTAAK